MSEDKNLKIKKRFFYEGVELALFLAESEGLCEYGEIAEFYGEIMQNAYKWFCESKYPEIIEEYDSCEDERKKFGGVVKYTYFMRVFVSGECEKDIAVSCEVCMKKGKEEKIFEFCDTQTWDNELGIMVREKRNRKKDA